MRGQDRHVGERLVGEAQRRPSQPERHVELPSTEMRSMSWSWGVNRGCVRRDMKAYVKATSRAVSGLPSCHLIALAQAHDDVATVLSALDRACEPRLRDAPRVAPHERVVDERHERVARLERVGREAAVVGRDRDAQAR